MTLPTPSVRARARNGASAEGRDQVDIREDMNEIDILLNQLYDRSY